jgi:hypothetical protein
MNAQDFCHIPQFSRNFSAKTRRILLGKGVAIIGAQAIRSSPDDTFFTGIGYLLVTKSGRGFLRTFEQVCCMANSSWTVAELDS